MSNDKDQSSDYLTFSQRYDYEPLPEAIQLEKISDDFRREVCNAVCNAALALLEYRRVVGAVPYEDDYKLIERVLGKYLRKPEHSISTDPSDVVKLFEEIIMKGLFHRVFDLVEIMANDQDIDEKFVKQIEKLFERYCAYRLLVSRRPYQIVPCASKEQCDAIQRAIETVHNGGMQSAAAHLRRAAAHINKQEYGDSIADSIHAVESVACVIDQKASKSLGPALDSLEQAGLLKHPALKKAFKNLYGYTSDEQGIRHALLDKDSPDVGLDEAVFMFGACASFAAYLVSKHRQAGQSEADLQ